MEEDLKHKSPILLPPSPYKHTYTLPRLKQTNFRTEGMHGNDKEELLKQGQEGEAGDCR